MESCIASRLEASKLVGLRASTTPQVGHSTKCSGPAGAGGCFQHLRSGRICHGTEGGTEMSTTLAPIKERAESCSLDNYLVLPDNTMDARIAAARRELGARVIVLGHHYQRDEVIRFADFRGDSYKLAQEAAHTKAEFIVFCGVHFMAESADVLAHEGQQVILPDLNSACPIA